MRGVFVAGLLLLVVGCSDDDSGGGTKTIIQGPENLFLIVDTVPVLDQADVSADVSLQVNTTREITPEFFDTVSFVVRDTNNYISGVLRYRDSSLVFEPGVILKPLTEYTATVSSSDPLQAFNYSWSFTTARDDRVPEVVSTLPVDGETGVDVTSIISIEFSRPIDVDSLVLGAVSVTSDIGGQVDGFVQYDAVRDVLEFIPYYPLVFETEYTVNVASTISDIYGTEMGQIYTFSFTTSPDNVPPTFYLSPANGETNISLGATIEADFNEPIDEATIAADSITVSTGGVNVEGSIGYHPFTYTVMFIPTMQLAPNTQYDAVLSATITDIAGNALGAPVSWSFSTGQDYTGPRVVSQTPAPDETGVAVDQAITIEFSEAIDPTTLGNTRLQLNYLDVPTTLSVSDNILTITPNTTLSYLATYQIYLDYRITDLYGNNMNGSSIAGSFTTEELSTFIDLGVSLNALDYDLASGFAYGVDAINKQLLTIDLNLKQVVSTTPLLYIPSDLCVDVPNNLVYIVNKGSTFVTELNLSTQAVRYIPWSGPIDAFYSDEAHYHIACTPDSIYLVDGASSPGLSIMDRADDTYVDSGITAVGDIVFTSDYSEFYTWYQVGWGAGYAGSDVLRYSAADLSTIDSTNQGYPDYRRDPLDSPILLDETSNRIINKRFVMNSLNLAQVYYTFPETDIIYAADFVNQYAVSRRMIYSLQDYNPVLGTPVAGDQMFFDNNGVLYMLLNSESKIYYHDINAALAPSP